jgi:HTH-type transcriptional regulator / antitoxin HigA
MRRASKLTTRAVPRDLPTRFDSLVRLHPPCAIHDEAAFENTQEMIDALTSLPALSQGQADYLETLTILLEAYEDEHHSIDGSKVGPRDVLRHLMGDHGMSASDLGRLLGERSLGVKVLNGHRDLSKSHIRKLAGHFKVSADLFM